MYDNLIILLIFFLFVVHLFKKLLQYIIILWYVSDFTSQHLSLIMTHFSFTCLYLKFWWHVHFSAIFAPSWCWFVTLILDRVQCTGETVAKNKLNIDTEHIIINLFCVLIPTTLGQSAAVQNQAVGLHLASILCGSGSNITHFACLCMTYPFQVLDFLCLIRRHAKCAAWGTPGASALWVSTDPTSRSECMRICDKHCSIWQFCICKLQVKSHHDCPSLNLTLREAWVDTVDHSKTEKQDCTKS